MVPAYTEEELQQLDSSAQQHNQIGMYPKETVEKLIRVVWVAAVTVCLNFMEAQISNVRADSSAFVRTPDAHQLWAAYSPSKDIFSPEAWEDVP